MRILIIGVSSTKSVGFSVGELLKNNNTVTYASRSGNFGLCCDATSAEDFDTFHGYAHRHTFHLHHKEYIINLTKRGEDLNEVFTASTNYIKHNFRKIKENYLRN